MTESYRKGLTMNLGFEKTRKVNNTGDLSDQPSSRRQY